MKLLLGSMCVLSLLLNIYFYFNNSHLQNERRWGDVVQQKTEKQMQFLVNLMSSKSGGLNKDDLKDFLINKEIELSERVEGGSVYLDLEGFTFRFDLNGKLTGIVPQK